MAILPYWPRSASTAHNMLAFVAAHSIVAFVLALVGLATPHWAEVRGLKPSRSSDALRSGALLLAGRWRILHDGRLGGVHVGPLPWCVRDMLWRASLKPYRAQSHRQGHSRCIHFQSGTANAWERTVQATGVLFVLLQFVSAVLAVSSLASASEGRVKVSGALGAFATLPPAILCIIQCSTAALTPVGQLLFRQDREARPSWPPSWA